MKKLLFVSFLAVIIVTLMGSVALAGGWTDVDYEASHDPDDTMSTTGTPGSDGIAIWNPEEYEAFENDPSPDGADLESPHGGFSASTNRCRVCHAVHLAGTGSWRLLRSGDVLNGEKRGMDRASECNYCHGTYGVTMKRPFRPKDYVVRGEHTLGSTAIPDSGGDQILSEGGLSCGNCHTVHGGGSLMSSGFESGKWGMKILRQDPNPTNGILAEGVDGRSSDEEMTGDAYATLSNFCGDCHDQNPNWNTSEDPDADPNSVRANGRSHVQGPTADGSLEVYGATMTVANWGSLDLNGDGGTLEPQNTQKGCRGCHAASSAGNKTEEMWADETTAPIDAESAWPHQTKGAKLLFDTYTQDTKIQTAAGAAFDFTAGNLNRNDADRILPRMDQLCMKCHRDTGTEAGTLGVGKTF